MDVPVTADTYPEVVVHVAGEDGFVVVRPLHAGRLVMGSFSKLLLEPLLVADHNLLAFGFQEADERLDNSQRSATDRDQNQNLTC